MSPYHPLLTADVEQLSAVVERLPTGVILIAGTSLEVVYANSAARRILHPVPLRRGHRLPDPWPGFSLPTYASRLFVPGVAPEEEVRSDDDHTYLVKGVTPRRSDVAAVLIDDISDRERRRRAEREFIANAAHELITPLTGLAGAAHVLEAGAKEVPEDRDRFIAHIADECERLTRTARSLLVLARAQSGEELPRLEVHSLCPILENAVESTAGGNAERLQIDCGDEITVLADADLLTQAVTNLITNALGHGFGEKVTITAAERPRNRVGIQFSEEGSRFLASEEAGLRRRFHTGSGRDGGGFGLGLSIASQSVQVMGGSLRLGDDGSTGVLALIELPSGRISST